MKFLNLNKQRLTILLLISISFNIYLVNKKSEVIQPEEIGFNVFRAGQTNNLMLLKKMTVEKPDNYWEGKMSTIQSKGSTSMVPQGFVAIKYDNGETLIIELRENLKHKVVISDLFFMGSDNSEFLKYKEIK